jgi:sulfonate transport system substrate-binding protein
VKLINVTSEAESSLLSGNLDAVVLTDSDALQLTETKKVAKSIISSREYPELSAQTIFVGVNSYMKDNPKVAEALFKGLIDAKDYFKSNPEESYKLLTKSGLSLDAIRKQYNANSPDFDIFTIGTDKSSIKKLDETEKFLLDHNLITQKFEVDKWLDNSYYEKAIK